MKKFLVPLLFLCIILAFFYKTFFLGLIPFPGDLLLSEYKPWQSYSFNGYVPGTIPNKAQYPDTVRQLYPWRTLVTNELKARRIPLWNPYNFSGTPLLANFQSAVFYPLNFLYLILPQQIAWTILVILQPTLGLLFTYWYVRKIGGSQLASALGALSYAFSLYATVWLQYNTIGHVILWLPLALLAVEHMRRKRTSLWFAILLFSQVSALLAGHPQLAGYLLVFVLTYSWFQARPVFKHIGTSTLLALGICAIQLIPGIELITYSARSPHDFSFIFQKILIQPQQLLMIAIPNLFGHPATRTYWLGDTFIGKSIYLGIIPLFFILSANRQKNSFVRFFIITAAITLVLMSANPVTFLLYKLNLPLISSSSPTLMSFLFIFSLTIATSLGLDGWIREKHSIGKLAHRSLTVTVFFIIVWWVYQSTEHYLTTLKAILYSGTLAGTTLVSFFIAITRKKLMIPTLVVLILIHAADLFFHFQKFNPFVPAAYIFPQTSIFQFLKEYGGINPDSIGVNRFWGYGTASIQANFATQYQLYSSDGYDPLYPKWYGEFIHASKDGKLLDTFTTQTRSDATIVSGYGELDLPNNAHRLRILDALSIRYILDRPENGSTQKTFPPERFSFITDVDGWHVYENKSAAPRIFLTSSYRVYQNPQEFNDIFFSDTHNPSKTILLKEPIDKPLGTTDNTSVELTEYLPTQISLTAVSHGNLLYLSDTNYPGWRAFIDGKPTKIYSANHAFRAMYVPSGTHTIRFTFFPLSFKIGFIISVLSIAASAVYILKHEHKT